MRRMTRRFAVVIGTASLLAMPIAPPHADAAGVLTIRQLVTGETDSCVLLSDTTVECWGRNDHGQQGNGTTTNVMLPAVVPNLSGVAQIAAGVDHTCALLFDTTIKCWGYNHYGELGIGSTIDSHVPVAVPGLSGVISIQVGDRHTCALFSDQTLKPARVADMIVK